MKIQNNQYLSIEQLQQQYFKPAKTNGQEIKEAGFSFREVLEKTAEGSANTASVKFSKHAANRLAERNIQLTVNQMDRLKEGAMKAGEKGIQDSLVVVDQLAFIVNVPNNTVITAMNQKEASQNVFTNIDGAVFM